MTVRIDSKMNKEDIDRILSSLFSDKGNFNAEKHCGVISIKQDIMLIQKELRDEW